VIKKMLLIFALMFSVFSFQVLASSNTTSALTCVNGNEVADAPANLTDEEKAEYEQQACIGFGGTQNVTEGCNQGSFFGLPVWYKYLDRQTSTDELTGAQVCDFTINGLSDVWLVVAAAIEILLRVSSMIAIGVIIYGGISYVISQGAPDKTKKAQTTVINAVIGLVVSVTAAAIVSFVAGRF
jgi:hypothetical protein